jgi:hypothetical protein
MAFPRRSGGVQGLLVKVQVDLLRLEIGQEAVEVYH